MAISHLVPETDGLPSDLVTLKEARDLIAQSPHPFSMTTMKRWIQQDAIETHRIDRTDYVSMSAMFIAHRDAVKRKAPPV